MYGGTEMRRGVGCALLVTIIKYDAVNNDSFIVQLLRGNCVVVALMLRLD